MKRISLILFLLLILCFISGCVVVQDDDGRIPSSEGDNSSSEQENIDQSAQQGARQAVEQALTAFTITNAVAGGELSLPESTLISDKSVEFEYSVMQGDDVCSLVENRLMFSSPREEEQITIKVKAVCDSASKEKEIRITLPAFQEQTLYETFEKGNVDNGGIAYTGGFVDAKRANASSSLSITEYNNSKALAVTCRGEMTYGAYAGFYINTKPNTTYQIKLDLNAVGVSTGDLSGSEYIHFEAYLNSNMGIVSNRVSLYNEDGKWVDNCPRISSLYSENGSYIIQFTTDDVANGYAYFNVKVRNGIGEDLTIYIDNLQIKETRTQLQESFKYGVSDQSSYNGKLTAKALAATIDLSKYETDNRLKLTTQSGRQSFLGLKLNVEKDRTYFLSLLCDLVGASGASYNDGQSEGDCASVFVVANTEDLTSAASRIFFTNNKGQSVTNAVLANLSERDNTCRLSFTAQEDGFVYLVIRTNKIAENAYLYVDDLAFADITGEVYDHNGMGYLNGIGEPLKSSNVQDFDQEKVAELYEMLNAQSSRMWFGTDIFKGWKWDAPLNTFVIDENVKEGYDEVLRVLENAGIKEITGMGLYLPITDSTVSSSDNHYVPMRGSSDYQIFLDKVYELWYEMAKAFPQITIWEVGNESNADFLRYKEYKHISYRERAQITADIIYYSNKGIKAANPNAITITPGFAPVTSYYTQNTNTDGESEVKLLSGIGSVEIFLKYLYAEIVSGSLPYHWGSKYVIEYDDNPDNYFDGVAWHPYDLGTIGYANTNDPDLDHFDVNLWVDANNACYKVMCDYGDADKGVWFTEFGIRTKESHLVYSPVSQNSMHEYCIYFAGGTVLYTPDGSKANISKQKISKGYYYVTFYDEDNYAKMQKTVLTAYYNAMCSDSMNYVHAWHYFRGFGGLKDYSWNGLAGIYCALFSESAEYLNRGFYPNHKAYILQELYGGKGDLMKYSTYSSVHTGDKQIGGGLTDSFNNGEATNLSGNALKYKGDIYAYSSNNNGAISVENGALVMQSDANAFIAFKLNGLEAGKTYSITLEISQSTSNTAFCIFTSDVSRGTWTAGTRIKPFENNYEESIKKLDINGNAYSYTFTPSQDYDSIYFTLRNNGTVVIESIAISVN